MASDDNLIGQSEIDLLLQQGRPQTPPAPAVTEPPPAPVKPSTSSDNTGMGVGDDIQFLLDQAEKAIASVEHPSEAGDGLSPFPFRDFQGSPPSEEKATLEIRKLAEDNRLQYWLAK